MSSYNPLPFIPLFSFVCLLGCSDDPGQPADTTSPGDLDAADDSSDATDSAIEVDDTADIGTDTDAADVDPRTYTHRAIGGMSMGAMALTIALERPYTFDMVGALGGYPDLTYMMSQMLRLHFGGFCDLTTLEAALPDLDQVTDCPAPTPRSELEFPQSFNHLHYDDNGITMTRGFYGEVIDNFSSAFGNLATPEHAEAPMLPAGIDLEWFSSTPHWQRCATNRPLAAASAFSAEANPKGIYQAYPLCDQDRPTAAGLAPSELDPDAPLNRPIDGLAFVDLDGDGVRHPQEPILLNPWERFSDTGPDGCFDNLEDGLGGCVDELPAPPAKDAARPVSTDPNGDNYHWLDNPSGRERDDRYDLGEPFSDLGLDGVDEAVTGAPDHGEGNGVWDASPAFTHLLSHDADTLIENIDAAALDAMDFWLDAGIRDALHAGVVARRMVASLTNRGRTVSIYRGFGGTPGNLAPQVGLDQFALNVLKEDLSARAIGRDIYVEYGNPDATPEQIANGDGKHVGTTSDAIDRLAAFLGAAFSRLPDPIMEVSPVNLDVSRIDHFYSPALGGRRGFTVLVPPDYEDAASQDRRYPVMYFLHGLGQDASDLAAVGLATSILMSEGTVPRVILVFPDGACCFVDTETGARECACGDNEGGVRQCVDPTCTGPSDTCEVRAIPDSRLTRECHKGSLYADMRSNRWGEPRSDMNYKTSVHELVDHVDRTYRTRATPR